MKFCLRGAWDWLDDTLPKLGSAMVVYARTLYNQILGGLFSLLYCYALPARPQPWRRADLKTMRTALGEHG